MHQKQRKRKPKPGTVRRRNHYQRARLSLIETLGGKCVECGCGELKELTFDHTYGRDWDVRSVHATKRLRIYTEEAARGLIQLLCLSCNSSKGKPDSEEIPF